ncbi:hypothetical protein [Daejeonella oryzae]|uniref:hypothetical protein n=1 Tax=Daejeonella oryzae TaxID=1122943 RepID=UPI000420E26A|nr:hypothetical protein [Daejeonella oryzae]
MKTLVCLLILFTSLTPAFSQRNVSGKWFGKITQQPGGYSELYDFELELNQKKNIWGDSYAYLENYVEIKIGLSGYFENDTIRLIESRDWVKIDKVPWNWVACIKDIKVVYRKENNNEYLEGSWTGFNKDDPNDKCIPGRVILSRTVAGLDQFLHENRDSVITAAPLTISDNPVTEINFDSPFLATEPRKVTEISVTSLNLQIQLIDYLKVDNDTVSVYLNRNILAKNVRISKRATLINFKLDPNTELNELLLYAENLGEIPPNTSQLLVIDGDQIHRIMISSDKQKTAAVYLKYKGKKPR